MTSYLEFSQKLSTGYKDMYHSEKFLRTILYSEEKSGRSSITLPLPSHSLTLFMAQSKHWVFTINNPTETDNEALERFKTWPKLAYIVFQREKASTEHFQGYVIFAKPIRITGARKLDARAHWEIKRGTTQQARDYCTKDDSRVSGPYEFGEAPNAQGTRTDLNAAIDVLRDGGILAVREQHPATYVKYSKGLHNLLLGSLKRRDTEREVTLLYGKPGTGKTRYFYEKEPDGLCLPCDQGFWFDGYEGQPAVLLDDFAGRASKWQLTSILRVLDRYNVFVPIKGSFVGWVPDRIYITTNIHPRLWYNYDERADQYVALVRRFTTVIIYEHGRTTMVARPDGYLASDKKTGDWNGFFHPTEPVTVNSADVPRSVHYLNQYDF